MDKLVLVSCCAPCSAGAIKQTLDSVNKINVTQGLENISDFIVLFYNPNIYPDTEYQKRLLEQIKYCEALGVKYFAAPYNHDGWLKAIQGLENEPEKGERCSRCFKYRFAFAQNFAVQNGYSAIASVLGVSKHKNQAQVDSAANLILDKVKYLSIKWDEDINKEENQSHTFYRQNYCGCEFSIRKNHKLSN